jgi:hypothetical protein
LALPGAWPIGRMAKADTKPIKWPQRTDSEQFERFIEAARKRRFDESLEDFAAKFFQDRATKKTGDQAT